MTLCIAAIARKEERIVTVSDFMLSTETMSAEPTISKLAIVGQKIKWVSMFAGDPTHAWSITDRVRQLLDNKRETPEAVIKAFQAAYESELENKINSEVLSPLGMTRDTFLLDGRRALGDETFNQLYYRILNTSLETDFLVGNCYRLFSIHHPSTVVFHDPLGFSAIGTGETLAKASLMGILNVNDTVGNIIYRLLEAKFRGESAMGVGKNTFVAVVDAKGNLEILPMPITEQIRKLWEEKGKAKIPGEVSLLITAFLKDQKRVKEAQSVHPSSKRDR